MDRRQRIERWFAQRGVPQLIEGYTSEQRMDARALPLLTAWVALATAIACRRPELPPTQNLVGVLLAMAGVASVLATILLLRRHPPFGGSRFDLVDIAMLGIVPGVASALVHDAPLVALGTISLVLTGVGLIYLITGFGLLELGGWALGHLRAQLGQIATLVSRTLPVLLDSRRVPPVRIGAVAGGAHVGWRRPAGGPRAPPGRGDDPGRHPGPHRDR